MNKWIVHWNRSQHLLVMLVGWGFEWLRRLELLRLFVWLRLSALYMSATILGRSANNITGQSNLCPLNPLGWSMAFLNTFPSSICLEALVRHPGLKECAILSIFIAIQNHRTCCLSLLQGEALPNKVQNTEKCSSRRGLMQAEKSSSKLDWTFLCKPFRL